MSSYTEKEIIAVAIKVVEEAGELSTTELKKILIEEMSPDGSDLEILKGRRDTKFHQKVGNIVSHRSSNDLLKYFEYRSEGRNGFLRSKSVSIQIKNETVESGISEKSSTEREIKKRREKKRRFTARKVDFEKINRGNRELGLLGEQFVLELEIQKLPSELAQKVRHVSVVDGDGTGYDILSYRVDGTPSFLEVKTTTGPKTTPFFLSENERIFIEEYRESAEIIRVYEFDRELKTGKVLRLGGDKFLKSVNLKPISYKAEII